MSIDEKRAARIIEAANQAISKMADPGRRRVAKAKLALAEKKLDGVSQHTSASPMRTLPSRDREWEPDR